MTVTALRTALIAAIVVLAFALAACAGTETEERQMPAPALPGNAGNPGSAGSSGMDRVPVPQPSAPTSPQQPAPPSGGPGGEQAETPADTGTEEAIASLVAQQRIIVRTVDMTSVVENVAASVDAVSRVAVENGGWVVSSNRAEEHQATISIRVPADRLDAAVLRLRHLAVEVKSEQSTSKDVTDEYVDLTARLKNLQATEQALRDLLARAADVEDALRVQQTLTQIQGEVESLQGRIQFLETTAAFSLINLRLELEAATMPVDAGTDRTAGVGDGIRFRATFTPPPGIDSYRVTWDFGDGTPEAISDRTTPTEFEGQRATATMTHNYNDERDSPFIATIKITGTGEAGIVEGEDTIIVTVTRVPKIEVFPGEGKNVEAGDEVQFTWSFTRPDGLRSVRHRWEFGDGSAPATGDLADGVTSMVTTHVYLNHRPVPYTATVTVSAESDAGPIETSGIVNVRVLEPQGWVIGGWDAENQLKLAVQALSGFGQVIASLLIWVAVFSLIWVPVVLAVVIFRSRLKGLGRTKPRGNLPPPVPPQA